MRDESIFTMRLDWVDAFLMLAGFVALLFATSALGIDALKLRGGMIILGVMLGPIGRRALVGPPAPYRDGHSEWTVFFGLILIAAGSLAAVMGAVLADLRHTQHKPWATFVLVAAAGVGLLAIGALMDRSQRDRSPEETFKIRR